MPRLPKHYRIAIAPLAVALVVGVAWKVHRTPEWIVLTGTEAERQEICRSVYKKPPWRAARLLRHLLNDRSAAVRIPAIEALAHCPSLHPRFALTIRGLAYDTNPRLRARALEYVFQHEDMPVEAFLGGVRTDLSEDSFRDEHPDLLASYVAAELRRGNPTTVAWALDLCENGRDLDSRAVQALLRHPELLRPFRDRLIGLLAPDDTPNAQFARAALTAIDGQMRGTQPTDWTRQHRAPQGGKSLLPPLERFTMEMEWAHQIDPNFQIDALQGEQCVYLGEGAGGDHFWRRHAHSTVNIGKIHVSLHLSRDDRYQIWCRCWFLDKCGNHSLLHIDDRWLRWRNAAYEDRNDPLQQWHWKRIETHVSLKRGQHTLTITAGDDGLLYDKLAVLPVRERFDPNSPPPMAPLFNSAQPTTISMTTEVQAQSRGTTQTISAWVRRNSEELTSGTAALFVPPPFRVEGNDRVDVSFQDGIPLAQADFRVHLPEWATAGEVEARTTFRTKDKAIAFGSTILGTNHDWYTTGPLAPSDPRCRSLRSRKRLTRDDLVDGWSRYPANGYDRFRRLNPEKAYGQFHNKITFLYTEIDVAQAGEYASFLTIDDNGFVFVDGKRVAGRYEEGVGEGWMHVDRCHLEAGILPVFVWIGQSNVPEPTGADAGRHTPNHCVFKWLLRKSRHRPTPHIRSVPVDLTPQIDAE
ncbi:MAG: hypothetical protein HN742_37200 [Lentisphaerae bacterium]|nr:hypothetical protein [Lentisphaerota bacterium]MBT5604321.1 hypothetical protein [Lentisphaerota bacterium]MBT7060268.1 hypothetical protein [Lentisphaerota bacterium]MBT7847565.1 hypothetical protein [Lentisphaerota bacterium]